MKSGKRYFVAKPELTGPCDDRMKNPKTGADSEK